MELKTYLNILSRRWRIVLVVTIVIALLITILGFSIPPKYEAETLLRVITPLGGRTGETNYQTTFAVRLMNTFAQIATRDEVMKAIGRAVVRSVPAPLVAGVIEDAVRRR